MAASAFFPNFKCTNQICVLECREMWFLTEPKNAKFSVNMKTKLSKYLHYKWFVQALVHTTQSNVTQNDYCFRYILFALAKGEYGTNKANVIEVDCGEWRWIRNRCCKIKGTFLIISEECVHSAHKHTHSHSVRNRMHVYNPKDIANNNGLVILWCWSFVLVSFDGGANVNEVLVCIFLVTLTLFADVALLLPLHVYLFIFIWNRTTHSHSHSHSHVYVQILSFSSSLNVYSQFARFVGASLVAHTLTHKITVSAFAGRIFSYFKRSQCWLLSTRMESIANSHQSFSHFKSRPLI